MSAWTTSSSHPPPGWIPKGSPRQNWLANWSASMLGVLLSLSLFPHPHGTMETDAVSPDDISMEQQAARVLHDVKHFIVEGTHGGALVAVTADFQTLFSLPRRAPWGPAGSCEHSEDIMRQLKGKPKKETSKDKKERKQAMQEARQQVATVVLPTLAVVVLLIIVFVYVATRPGATVDI